MGAAKKIGIIIIIYLIAGFVVSYMLAMGMLSTEGMFEYVALIFYPVIFLWNILAPYIGMDLISYAPF